MELSGEQHIPASRERVWQALNDPDVLQRCIPGAETLSKLADDAFEATVAIKVGPVRTRFSGKVTLSDLDPPNGYTISGEGSGGSVGFAKGSANVSLAEAGPEATNLSYVCDVQVGGKLAQIGSRMISGTANKMAGDFFASFAEAVSEQAPEAVKAALLESKLETPAEPERSAQTALWVALTLLFVALTLLVTAR